jgi:hypothetical protein
LLTAVCAGAAAGQVGYVYDATSGGQQAGLLITLHSNQRSVLLCNTLAAVAPEQQTQPLFISKISSCACSTSASSMPTSPAADTAELL